MTFDAKQFLSSVSTSPGVYRMLDEEQNTLYVGKAKRLKARLASYFRGQLNTKTQAMVARIADIQISKNINMSQVAKVPEMIARTTF